MNEPHPVTFYSTVNMSLFSGENWLVIFCMKQCPSIPSHAQEGRQELVLPGGGVQRETRRASDVSLFRNHFGGLGVYTVSSGWYCINKFQNYSRSTFLTVFANLG